MSNKFQRIVPKSTNITGLNPEELKILNITCSSTMCGDDLHCFSRYMKRAKRIYNGDRICYNCGNDSIDWERIHQRKITDSDYIFQSLNKELIRKIFMTMQIKNIAITKAITKGRIEVEERAQTILQQRVGQLTVWDGRQTPLGGEEIINYAQHATATCCRKCMQAWYDIPLEAELSQTQLTFCVNLVMMFIDEKVKFPEA